MHVDELIARALRPATTPPPAPSSPMPEAQPSGASRDPRAIEQAAVHATSREPPAPLAWLRVREGMYVAVEGNRVNLALDRIGRDGRRVEVLTSAEAQRLAALLEAVARCAGE